MMTTATYQPLIRDNDGCAAEYTRAVNRILTVGTAKPV